MDSYDNWLSPEEKAAFAALERERDPGDLLEERTVRRLRRHGLLASSASTWPVLSPLRAAVAAAAMVVVALCSFMLGHWSGSRQTAEVMLAMHQHDTLLVAREVQRAGSAYLAALERLANVEASEPDSLGQGREVALATFRAAASELITLAPDDPLAGDILRAIDERRARTSSAEGQDEPDKVVWF
jgi:hypothetical protein